MLYNEINMSALPEMPRQRAGREAASRLRDAAIEELQPLHDTLLDESPQSFDGLVSFAIDKWHESSASAVATVQPLSNDDERFAFYRNNIESNRIDLSATAFGDAMRLPDPQYLQSRMNPEHHLTYAPRIIIDGRVVGGVQAAFNTTFGKPIPEKTLESIWKDHTPAVKNVLHEFDMLANPAKLRSIGDTLELLAPTTPNAFVISWDMAGSTKMALSDKNYGALRNYLLDAKGIFNQLSAPYKGDYHDNGDGQDMIIWLPEGVDRADTTSVASFGHETVIPLLEDIQQAQRELVTSDYTDINPQIRFAIGLAHVEKNHFEGRTSRELWEIDQVMNVAPRSAVGYTKAARRVLGILSDDARTKK